VVNAPGSLHSTVISTPPESRLFNILGISIRTGFQKLSNGK
jgi:hypothetical protein